MSDRIYPENFIENQLKQLRVDELLKEIGDLHGQVISINAIITSRREEIEKICPHLYSKEENEYNEGGYLNRGSHVWMKKCVSCGKELDRKKTDTGYA